MRELGMRAFFSLKEMLIYTGLSRQTVYRLRLKGDFPKARRLSGRRIGFLVQEAEQWIASRP